MEKYLTALLTQKTLRDGEVIFSSEGSAILALRRENSYYLISTGHQATHLRIADQSWVYLPTLDKIEPLTVVAESQNPDLALLRFETAAELETINPPLSGGDWMIDCNSEVMVYGFPKQDGDGSRDIGEVISRLELRKTLASVVGVMYNSDEGLRLMINQPTVNGESGGLTVSIEGAWFGVNQAHGSSRGLVIPVWETASLFRSLELV